jgi:hypothetical protein
MRTLKSIIDRAETYSQVRYLADAGRDFFKQTTSEIFSANSASSAFNRLI